MGTENSRDDMALALTEHSQPESTSREVVPVQQEQPVARTENVPALREGESVVERKETPVTDEPAARQREADGRWAPRTPAQAPTPQRPAQGLRPPVSWKPEAREVWAKVPLAAQMEIQRRDREVDDALRTSASARAHKEEFDRAVSPFLHFFAQEGATPMQGFQDYLRTSALLRTGAPGQKAKSIADLCMYFGVDLAMLDNYLTAALGGKPAPAPQANGHADPNLLAAIDQRLKPVTEFMTTVMQSRQQTQQQMEQTAAEAWDAFVADPANEFANDVRDEIADLLVLAANRGQPLSLPDAYKRATLAHPTISELIRSRGSASSATQQTAAARRALDAAASVTDSGGAPSRGGEEEGDGSTRSDIMAAVRQHSAQR